MKTSDVTVGDEGRVIAGGPARKWYTFGPIYFAIVDLLIAFFALCVGLYYTEYILVPGAALRLVLLAVSIGLYMKRKVASEWLLAVIFMMTAMCCFAVLCMQFSRDEPHAMGLVIVSLMVVFYGAGTVCFMRRR